jgi:hypothetical protein
MHACAAMGKLGFRRALVELVLIGAPLATAGCSLYLEPSDPPRDSDPVTEPPRPGPTTSGPCTPACYEHHLFTTLIREPPPPDLEPLVRACEADAQSCFQLCAQLVYGESPLATIQTCNVEHDSLGHTVYSKYSIDTGAPGCGLDVGRRPAGLRHVRRRCADRIGAELARAAY